MTIALATLTAVIFLTAAAITAYHNGKRHGRVTLPTNLVEELREHKLHCIGEPAERVALEIALLCDATDRVGAPLSR